MFRSIAEMGRALKHELYNDDNDDDDDDDDDATGARGGVFQTLRDCI
jgi:hypothetical protein